MLLFVRWEMGALLISVSSVLQSLSLGFAEPAPLQGSQIKIIYCDKNLLAKLVATSFCAAYAARCVGVTAPYKCTPIKL